MLAYAKHPGTLLIASVLGIASALLFPALASMIIPLGAIYLALLKMCAIPIVLTAVTSGFARLFKQDNVAAQLRRISRVFSIGLILAGALGVSTGMAVKSLVLSDGKLESSLSEKISQTEALASHQSASEFFLHLIPQNIFKNLADGEIINILIFSILFGIAIGFDKRSPGQTVLQTFEGVTNALFRIMEWILYLLPFGLCALFAKTFAPAEGGLSIALFGKIILACALGLLGLITVNILILCKTVRKSPVFVLQLLRQPAIVAVSTSSSLSTLPSIIIALEEKLKLERWVVELILPLGVTFHQQASIFFYSMIGIIVAHIYHLPLGPSGIMLIVAGALLQSIAGAGLPALASLAMLGPIFRALGLPVEIFITLVLAIDPLLDPFLTMTNVIGNLTAATVIATQTRKN